MADFSQFFSPAAFGSWSQPAQSMLSPKPPMSPGGMTPPGAPQGGGMGGNPLSALMGAPGAGQGNNFLANMLSGAKGNPMMSAYGSAMMSGKDPMAAMMGSSGDFAKWMANHGHQQGGPQTPAAPGMPGAPPPVQPGGPGGQPVMQPGGPGGQPVGPGAPQGFPGAGMMMRPQIGGVAAQPGQQPQPGMLNRGGWG